MTMVLFNLQDLTSGMVQMVEEGKEVGRLTSEDFDDDDDDDVDELNSWKKFYFLRELLKGKYVNSLRGRMLLFVLLALGQESHLILDFGIQEILPQMRILIDNNVHTQTTYSIMMMASLPKNLEILLSSLTESLSWFPFFHPTKHKNKEKIKGKKTKVETSQKSYFFLFSLSKFVLFLSSLQLSSSLLFFFFVKQRQTTEGLRICLVQPLQEA